MTGKCGRISEVLRAAFVDFGNVTLNPDLSSGQVYFRVEASEED